MAHQLSFEHLIRYDPAEAGVTVDVALKLFERRCQLCCEGGDTIVLGIVDYEGKLLLSLYNAP